MKGTMRSAEVASIVDAILRLPYDSEVCVDLRAVTCIDAQAAEAFAAAVLRQQALGVEFSIAVGTEAIRIALDATGLASRFVRCHDVRGYTLTGR